MDGNRDILVSAAQSAGRIPEQVKKVRKAEGDLRQERYILKQLVTEARYGVLSDEQIKILTNGCENG